MREETREVICILCPVGCKIIAEMRGGEILSLRNAGCRRGIDYAEREIKSPVRDFFTTIMVKNGRLPVVSVRSTGPVPKSMLMRCASELANIVIPAPVKIGDVIVKNLMNLGVDIIATRDVEEA
jgi:CxxC motif-containing protein